MYSQQQLQNFKRHFYKRRNVRPFLRITKDGQSQTFETIHQCAQALYLPARRIWMAFVQEGTVRGYRVTPVYAGDKEARVAKIDKFIQRTNRISPLRPVKLYDTETTHTHLFSSVTQAAKFLSVSVTNVRHRLTTPEKLGIIKQRYIVMDDDYPVKMLTPEVIKALLARRGRTVSLLDTEQHTVERFPGLAQFTQAYQCKENKTHIIYALKTYGVYLHAPGQYLVRDLKQGEPLSDEALWQLLAEKVKEN